MYIKVVKLVYPGEFRVSIDYRDEEPIQVSFGEEFIALSLKEAGELATKLSQALQEHDLHGKK